MRAETICFSMSTFYKYAHFFESKRVFRTIQFREKNHFRASYPFEYLHIDTTKIFTQQQGWQRAVFVKDNYSKSLLHMQVVPTAGSSYIKDVIANTFKKYDLFSLHSPITIISDNGSENKGELSKWLSQNRMVHRVIAKIDTDISNNMVESSNHQFKNVFLKNRVLPKTKEELLQYLDEFEHYINLEWTPGEFYGLTPNEVLHGEYPDKDRFKQSIKRAQIERVYQNQHIGLELCKVCGQGGL